MVCFLSSQIVPLCYDRIVCSEIQILELHLQQDSGKRWGFSLVTRAVLSNEIRPQEDLRGLAPFHSSPRKGTDIHPFHGVRTQCSSPWRMLQHSTIWKQRVSLAVHQSPCTTRRKLEQSMVFCYSSTLAPHQGGEDDVRFQKGAEKQDRGHVTGS